MGKYAVLTTLTREFREDLATDVDIFVHHICREKASEEGYTPVGEPSITWYEITQDEVDMELWMQREGGVAEPVAPFQAGDWRVRAVIDVAEDDPLPSRGGPENIARLR